MDQITPEQLKAWLIDDRRDKPLLLDVREDWEVEVCPFPQSKSIVMNSIPARLNELDRETATVVICHHGARSFQVGLFLERAGFTRLFNLAGGIDAWARRVDPSVGTY